MAVIPGHMHVEERGVGLAPRPSGAAPDRRGRENHHSTEPHLRCLHCHHPGLQPVVSSFYELNDVPPQNSNVGVLTPVPQDVTVLRQAL